MMEIYGIIRWKEQVEEITRISRTSNCINNNQLQVQKLMAGVISNPKQMKNGIWRSSSPSACLAIVDPELMLG